MVIRYPVQPADELHVVADTEVVKQRRVIWHVCEFAFQSVQVGLNAAVSDGQRTSRGRNEARNATHCCGFSCAIGANQPADLTLAKRKTDAVDCKITVIQFSKTIDLNHLHALHQIARKNTSTLKSSSQSTVVERKPGFTPCLNWNRMTPS